MRKRNTYSGEFKARVAVDVIKGQKTVNEIAEANGIHPMQAGQWKKHALEVLPGAMSDKRKRTAETAEQERDKLYAEIGRLRMELEWLKKKSGVSLERKG